MAVAVPGAVPSLCCSRAHAELPCGNARARLSHSRLNLPPLCCCPGLPHAVYAAEVRGEKIGFFYFSLYVGRRSGHRPRAPVRGPRARARVGPSLTAPGAHRSQVLPGERMLGPPELWPVRHYAAPQAVVKPASLPASRCAVAASQVLQRSQRMRRVACAQRSQQLCPTEAPRVRARPAR